MLTPLFRSGIGIKPRHKKMSIACRFSTTREWHALIEQTTVLAQEHAAHTGAKLEGPSKLTKARSTSGRNSSVYLLLTQLGERVATCICRHSELTTL